MNIINNNNDVVTSLKGNIEKSKQQRDKELKETCAAFEGMFMQMMMKTMRSASIESNLIKKSNGEKIFTDLLDQEYVNIATKNEATGLGGTLYQYLKNTLPEYKDNNNYFYADSGKNAYEMRKTIESSKELNSNTIDLLK